METSYRQLRWALVTGSGQIMHPRQRLKLSSKSNDPSDLNTLKIKHTLGQNKKQYYQQKPSYHTGRPLRYRPKTHMKIPS